MHVSGLAVPRNNTQTIVFVLLLFDCCASSAKKYCLGTSKCHDCDLLTLHQPIRLQVTRKEIHSLHCLTQNLTTPVKITDSYFYQ